MNLFREGENYLGFRIIGPPSYYTKKGRVELSVYMEGSNTLVFRVSDTGIGILKEDTGRLFTEYSQRGEPRYNMILMDHMMPEMDGIEAVRIIRNGIDSDYARTIPIVALTANVLAGNEEMFLEHGFNGFISKPIDIVRLDGILKKWAG
jgi:CheY-like chemotaxis protein